MAARINDTEVRKRQILEEASKLFLEKGYAGVGIDEIAAACGIVRGTVLRYFHSKKELYDEIIFGRANPTGHMLDRYCEDKSIPVLNIMSRILMVLEVQFVKNIELFREKLKEEEFRQNFDVFRLPIFRSEAKMLEKLLIRGNEEGVWQIDHPHIRAYSFAFAMFGLAETVEVDTDVIRKEIWEVAEAMLQVRIPRESVASDETEERKSKEEIENVD